MVNVIPAAPVAAMPVVNAGMTGPTGPSGHLLAAATETMTLEQKLALIGVTIEELKTALGG